jgi:hypothetical protein
MRFVFTLFFFSSVCLIAQTISFGVKGGGFLTEPAERFDQSGRYAVGPAVEILSPWKVALEVNALYSRFGSALSLQGAGSGRTRGNSWELPILGKYYFTDRRSTVRPFASSGFSLRKTWFDDGDRYGSVGRPGERRTGPFDRSSDLGVGAVVSGGASFGVWKVRIAPEIRYTRWGGDNFPLTNANQVQGLVGITF